MTVPPSERGPRCFYNFLASQIQKSRRYFWSEKGNQDNSHAICQNKKRLQQRSWCWILTAFVFVPHFEASGRAKHSFECYKFALPNSNSSSLPSFFFSPCFSPDFFVLLESVAYQANRISELYNFIFGSRIRTLDRLPDRLWCSWLKVRYSVKVHTNFS